MLTQVTSTTDQLLQAFPCCQHDPSRNPVRVAISSGPAVLQVTLSVLFSGAGNSDGGPSVSNGKLELINATCLVLPSEALVVSFAVFVDVFLGFRPECFTNLLDHLIATFLTHGLNRKIGAH